ncbi:MAG: TlyA family RNA methyltransferase [Andreesenia angusta]|nr:TlyA family RNA methyltransferase [Andreesenia angusta]
MKKERIDILLVEKGYFDSREKAKRTIMAGLVLVDDEVVDKAGTKVDISKEIRIKGNPIPFVSRGGLKLDKALKEFDIDLNGKTALDIGASTGGFSDCMLQNGVSKIFAIDVGYGQLDWKIRSDKRVVAMDRTNIRNVEFEDIGELVDFASIDVSFISLKLVLPVVKKLTKEEAEIVALIKPQFEIGKDRVGKKGIVKNIEDHKDVILDINSFCKENDLFIHDLTYSPVKGAEGNIEYLAHIKKYRSKNLNTEELLKKIVEESHEYLK